MSDGAISQSEIDALLAGVDMSGMGGGSPVPSPVNSSSVTSAQTVLPAEELAVIQNMLNDTVGSLKSNLDLMTGESFSIVQPAVEILAREQMMQKLSDMAVTVVADFSEGISGEHLFILAPEFAQKLAGLINKEEDVELDEMSLSVISEIMSQHVGTEITALSAAKKIMGIASIPPEAVNVPKAMVRFPQQSFLCASFPVTFAGGAYTLYEIFSVQACKDMLRALGAVNNRQNMGANPMMGNQGFGNQNFGNQMGSQGFGNTMGMNGQQFGGYGNQGMGQIIGNPMGMNTPNVQSLQYPSLQMSGIPTEQGNIGLIMDVFMEMTVELGRTKKQIKEILGMGEGTIIELDKLAGEPVDILVNHKPIAKGEVVVIDENFGVRVTEILSPMERVSDLN